jgi:hypothetical protein
MTTYFKDADAILDYDFDWSEWLGSATIVTSTFTVPSGITEVTDSHTDTVTAIRLSGGTWGESYVITNHIVDSDGEEDERSITIRIQQEQRYCSNDEVRRRMFGGSGSGGSATTTALPEAELDALIEQASRMFDLACNVPAGYFSGPAFPFASDRTIYGDGTNYLKLPPYVPGSLSTTITVPTGYTAPSFVERDGYLILATSDGVLPPFRRFYNCSWPGWWSGVAVTVSAQWGIDSTPPDVKLAVIELVINLARETDPENLKMVNLDGVPLREKMPPRVAEIARRYRTTASGVFA